MKKNILKCTASIIAILWCGTLMAQGTIEDYQRAYSLYGKFNEKNVYHQAQNVRWVNKEYFTYTTNTPKGTVYYLGKTENTTSAPSLQTIHKEKIVTLLAEQSGKKINAEKMQFENFEIDRNQPHTVRFTFDGFHWIAQNSCSETVVLTKEKAIEPPRENKGKPRHWMEVDDEKGNRPVVSPDGKLQAYIKNDNVCISDRNGKNERVLSNDGTLGNYYSSRIQWSPNGKFVATVRIRPVEKRFVYYVESSPKSQLQPILHQQEYAKPGDELRFKVPCIFDLSTGKSIIPSTALFDKQYELHQPVWNKNSQSITFEYNERGHKTYRVLEMNAETGNVRTLIEENSRTFVNYSRQYRHRLKDDKQMIWMSERDNWTHLYLYDLEKAKVKKQITRGEWVVRRVLRVDEERNLIFFTASGVNPKEDPYLIHYYTIGLDGKNMTCLTPEEGKHNAVFNEDYTCLIDTYSKVNQAPVTILRHISPMPTEGNILARADISKLKENGWVAPEIFTAPGRDGTTPIWGIIQRPTNFDPNKKYPVIEYIYAGPGDAYTPKNFNPYNWNMNGLAELGFIVVQLDGMGTSYRGKKFEDVCYKNLKDAGFADRKAWIRAAATQYPYMDAENVGIFGASAGGQESTTAVLLHPDFYKAAYSSCGCHDNRMDKIWWNEQWMGYPVDSSYIESSNVENASKLTRPLMLVVGELDDNVDPASTMQVVNALVKANKDFELVVLPGVGHTMGESYGEHKRYDFFVRHLLKVNPPAWNELEKKP